MTDKTSPNYDSITITLHWATATLVVVLWVTGQTAGWIPKGPINTDYRSIHVVLGFALTILLLWRIIWRGVGGRRLPAADTGALQILAEATHTVLYLLLLTALTLGVVNAFVRAHNLFDVVSLPQLGDRALRRSITQWHGLAANLVLGLAFLHAAAALAHHYVFKDGVLRRMLPVR
ncbi:MAG: cytochrome b [Hyphomicrobiales bacterium]